MKLKWMQKEMLIHSALKLEFNTDSLYLLLSICTSLVSSFSTSCFHSVTFISTVKFPCLRRGKTFFVRAASRNRNEAIETRKLGSRRTSHIYVIFSPSQVSFAWLQRM